jgi:hypothetical protein
MYSKVPVSTGIRPTELWFFWLIEVFYIGFFSRVKSFVKLFTILIEALGIRSLYLPPK